VPTGRPKSTPIRWFVALLAKASVGETFIAQEMGQMQLARLLFGIGAKALPSLDSKIRWNNLHRGAALRRTAGPGSVLPEHSAIPGIIAVAPSGRARALD
jgi:hypothetical protein